MDIIPISLPLDLPAPMWFLKFALITFFLVHILFIAFMIGGTFMTVFFRMLRKEDPFWSRMAREMGNTVTVNKSIAVVIGIAPLLAISLVYTNFFYAANNITAPLWLSIIWLVALAFISLYIYKYTWDSTKYSDRFKYFWGVLAFAIFMFVPLIFLSNINLMLYPDQWKNIYGFWQAIWAPNVLPRYLHFLNASVALTGFFTLVYFNFKLKDHHEDAAFYTRAKNLGAKWAMYATLLQLLFGFLNYVTLPVTADSPMVLYLIIVAIIVAGIAVYLLSLNLYAGKNIHPIIIFFVILVVASIMGTLRHVVRENALREPKKIMAMKTDLYRAQLATFMKTYSPTGEVVVTGESVFQGVCMACHAIDHKVVGPPMQYAIDKYKNDRDAMIQFVNSPRKINPDFPIMPKPPISEKEIELVVDYLLNLEVGSNE
ncbi:cytochrome ubiquinol oxidase subunit I [candidate division KSB1 bacterium]|nr:cytochrome ubiquinol oxidase subunit I [candidate division KSB1 bacterium]